jgi:hypothetical protein
MATTQTAKFASPGVSGVAFSGTLDVLTGLAGSRVGACVLSLATVLAAMRSLSTHGLTRLPLVVAALGTLPLLYAVAPYMGALPYSRYMMPALPATALLLGELMADVVGRVFAKPDRIAPALAVFLAVGLWAVGPRRTVDDGPYSNGYLSLVPLSAYDVPFALPEFYRTFEAGARIIEVPSLPSRARYLYRNYYLQHRRPTLLGLLNDEAETPLPGPYVVVDAPADLGNRADYLVFHLDVADELAAYFDFARQQVPAQTPHLGGLVTTQRSWSGMDQTPSKELIATLTAKHGPPLVDDGKFLVYRLRSRP